MNLKSSKSDCCGCTACASVCELGAIAMVEDDEGFKYPVVNDLLCVNCGLCKKVCHFGKELEPISKQNCYAAINTDERVHISSRSGGIFVAFANYILSLNGVIYGVALKNFVARTIRVEERENLNLLQNSKYVQSDKGNCFEDLRNDLLNGRYVLFSGTPCEVDGLLSFLKCKGTDISKLYTCDIVCHGVPSPLVWSDNISYLERKWGKSITDANFRDKTLSWSSHIESYVVEDRIKYSNIYTSLFYLNVVLRPSCSNCSYCNYNRPSDLTLGDFWGLPKSYFNKNKRFNGISMCLVNTNKGEQLLNCCIKDICIKEVNKDISNCQPNLMGKPSIPAVDRIEFWDEYNAKGFNFVVSKYVSKIDLIKVPYNRLKREFR